MLRKGFTLIELLIVITIIAILAGAAIPYVQDYVDDARYARAKADLTEIRNALVRFETDRGVSYPTNNIGELVGPYLQKVLVDPWGGSYVVDDNASLVRSNGPDGTAATGDEVSESFRPPLALSKAYWEDSDLSGTVNNGDSLILKFTRPTSAPAAIALADLTFSAGAPTVLGATTWNASTNNREVKIVMTTVPGAPFVPGLDTLLISAAGQATIQDPAGNNCKAGQPIPIRAR